MEDVRSEPQFTPQARRLWEQIPEIYRQRLLANVWCRTCGATTTIVDYQGRVEGRDVLLTGQCAICGGNMARLVEAE